MAQFTGTPGQDTFIGSTSGQNFFHFNPSTLNFNDIVTGNPNAGLLDFIVLDSVGPILPGSFASVTHVDAIALSGGSRVTLSDSLVAGADAPVFQIFDAEGTFATNTIDTTFVGAGRSVLFNAGGHTEIYTGGAGDDYFQIRASNLSASDTFSGGGGTNWLIISGAGSGAQALPQSALSGMTGIDVVKLATGGELTLSNGFFGDTANVFGTNADEHIFASGVTDHGITFVTGGGNDMLLGTDQNDFFHFFAGELDGGDIVAGGLGADTVVLYGGVFPSLALLGFIGIELFTLNGGTQFTLLDQPIPSTSGFVVESSGFTDIVDAHLLTANALFFYSNGGFDAVRGGALNDVFWFRTDTLDRDALVGEGGHDYIVLEQNAVYSVADLQFVSAIEEIQLRNGGTVEVGDANVGTTDGRHMMLIGSAAVDVLDASAVANALNSVEIRSAGGADVMRGGAGDDRFTILDGSYAELDGNGGFDIIQFASTDAAFDLTLVAAKTSDIEGIDLRGAGVNLLTLTDPAVTAVTGGGNSLYIAGDADDQIDLGGGWTQIATGITEPHFPGLTFTHFLKNGVNVYVDQTIPGGNITNIINGPPVAVDDNPNPGAPIPEGISEFFIPPGTTVLSNDTDPDGPAETAALRVVQVIDGTGAPVAVDQTPGATTTVVGKYGTLTIKADGTYNYILNNLDPDTNALSEGQPVTDDFVYTAANNGGGAGNEDTATLSINIVGRNDPPTFGPVTTADHYEPLPLGDATIGLPLFASNFADISMDGRFVTFDTDFGNLTGDPNAFRQNVILWDRTTQTFTQAPIDGSSADVASHGKFIAYVSADVINGNPAIFLWDVAANTAREMPAPQVSPASGPDNSSVEPSISADGRYIAFQSAASNLTEDDGNGSVPDIFVWDTVTDTIVRMPAGDDPVNGPDGSSLTPSISANGRFIAFETNATNIDGSGLSAFSDVIVWDRVLGTVQRIDHTANGFEADGASFDAHLSASGRFVAFSSNATNLTLDDNNGATTDAYVWDRELQVMQRMPTGATVSNGASFVTSISADGRFVGFTSSATNLVAGHTLSGGADYIYLWDRALGTISLMPPGIGGEPNGSSNGGEVSADGRSLALDGEASNLQAGDVNAMRDAFLWSHAVDNIVASFTELWSVTGSTVVHSATGTVNFFDVDLLDSHTITDLSLVFALAKWTTGANEDLGPLASGDAALLASTMGASITDAATLDGQGTITWTFAAQDNVFDFLQAGERLLLTYNLQIKDTPGAPASTQFVFAISGASDAPVAAPFTLASGSEDPPVPIAIVLSGTDVDAHDTMGFRLLTTPSSDDGTLYIDAALTQQAVLGRVYAGTGSALTLYFVPTDDFNGTVTFQYTPVDGGGLESALPGVAQIDITAVNDALLIDVIVAPVTFEDFSTEVCNTVFFDVDADAAADVMIVTYTVEPGRGTLAATSSLGVTVVGGSGTGQLVLSGTLDAINAFVAADLIEFTPALNDSGNVGLTIAANDQGKTGSGGPQVGTATTAIEIFPVADAPDFIIAGDPGAGAMQPLGALGDFPVYSVATTDLAGGRYAVVWTAGRNDNGSADENVYAQVFEAGGSPVGGEIEVSDQNAVNDSFGRVTALDTGGFAMLWQRGDAVFTRVYDADGIDLTGEMPVSEAAGPYQAIEIRALSDGPVPGMFATLYENNGDVFVQVFDSSGLSSGEIMVNDPNAVSDFVFLVPEVRQQLVALVGGGFAVIWTSLRDDADGSPGVSDYDVFVRVFDAVGFPDPNGEIQVNAVNTLMDEPRDLIALADGGFAVLWWQPDGSGAGDTLVQSYHPDGLGGWSTGTPVGFTVNAVAPSAADGPFDPFDLVALSGGGFAAMWTQANDVHIRVFDGAGHDASGDISFQAGDTDLPTQLVALSNGGFAVLYTGERTEAGETAADIDTLVRVFDANGTPVSGEVKANASLSDDAAASESDFAVRLIALPGGGFAVEWTRDVTVGADFHQDLYLRQFTNAGVAIGSPIFLAGSGLGGNTYYAEATDSASETGSVLAAALASDGSTQSLQVITVNPTVSGDEDTPIALPAITAAVTDTDGSETLAVLIAGIPDGAVLTDGTNSFTASPGDNSVDVSSWTLASLTITPVDPGAFALSVEVTVTDTATVGLAVVSDVRTATKYINVDVAANEPPNLSGPDTVVARAGTDAFAMGIGVPVDPEGGALTVTVDVVPTYGTVTLNGNPVSAGAVISAADLANLAYVAPGIGEFHGESLSYSVSDGSNTVSATIPVFVVDGFEALYFSAVAPGAFGPDLYYVDASGSANAFPIRNDPLDAGADFGSRAGQDGGFHQLAGSLYFFADYFDSGASSVVADALLKLDSSFFGTTFAPVSGVNGTGEDAHFTLFDGSLYLRGLTSDGDELVRIDTDGVAHTIDINVGPGNSFPGQNGGFIEFDGSLYFSVDRPDTGVDLFRLDTGGTLTALDLRSGTGSSFAGEYGGYVAFNGSLYFDAFADATGDVLFRLDAGSTTATPIDEDGLGHYLGATFEPTHFTEFDGALYLRAFTIAGDELVRINADGSVDVIDINAGAGANSSPGRDGGFIAFDGALYFSASVAGGNAELLKLDAGSLVPTALSYSGNSLMFAGESGGYVVFNNALYFNAFSAAIGQEALFRLDSAGAIAPVDDGSSGFLMPTGEDAHFTVFDGNLYLRAFTPDGDELVRIDGTGVTHVIDVNTGAGNNSSPGQNGGFGIYPGLVGGSGDDLIVGGVSDDTLIGNAGNDTLIGQAGADTFVFGPGFGKDLIGSPAGLTADFVSGLDAIEFDSSVFANFAAVQAHMQDVGTDAVIFDGVDIASSANTLTIKHVFSAGLSAADFHFV